MADVYIMSISDAEKIDLNFFEKHFPNRYEKSKRFVKKEDRLRSISSGVLLFGALNVTESEIETDENGKPYLKDFSKQFNLSHSGNYAVLAVDDERIGVDIELIDKRHLSVASKVFTEEEKAWMEQNPLERFFVLWTLKESVIKLLGVGLKVDLKSFSVLGMLEGTSIEVMDEKIYGKSKKFGDCVLSVCSVKQIKEINEKRV